MPPRFIGRASRSSPPRHRGQRPVPPITTAVAAVRKVPARRAARACSGVEDRLGRNTGFQQLQASRRRQIETMTIPCPMPDGSRKPARHLGSDLVAARPDARTDVSPDLARRRPGGRADGVEHAPGESGRRAPPATVGSCHGSGSRQDEREAVGSCDGQHHPGCPGEKRVTVPGMPRTVHRRNLGSVNEPCCGEAARRKPQRRERPTLVFMHGRFAVAARASEVERCELPLAHASAPGREGQRDPIGRGLRSPAGNGRIRLETPHGRGTLDVPA